ncbi:MAG TPA: VWA domain-containing protein [Silvibacterium sp.]|nr:VWA domain-containing protein [Silvibacterium sp.]
MSIRRYFWISLLCAALPALAQQAPASNQAASPALSSGPTQFTVDVNVTDKAGKPVSGLQKQDFTLLEDNRPLNIPSFQEITSAAGSTPTQVTIVLDSVNTSFQTLSSVRHQLYNFFQQNGGHLPVPVTLAIFSYSGLNAQEQASNDGRAALDFLNRNPIPVHADNGAQGEAGAFDRIDRSLGAVRSMSVANLKIPGRKLLIWVSPGWPVPMESTLGLTSREKQAVFNRIVSTTGLLLVSRTSLYSVDPLGTADAGSFFAHRYQDYLKEIKSPQQPQVANLGLQVFAIHSGGRVFSGSNDLTGELNHCIDDATDYYTLSFDPPRADHPNEYQHLEIKLDKPDLKARTRSGYYMQP